MNYFIYFGLMENKLDFNLWREVHALLSVYYHLRCGNFTHSFKKNTRTVPYFGSGEVMAGKITKQNAGMGNLY
jgi:hypothetical protein